MRIAVAGLQHESNTFLPGTTPFSAFERPGGWPPLSVGSAMLEALAGTSATAAGALAAARDRSDVTIVPIQWGLAQPSAPIARDAFDTLANGMVDRIGAAQAEHPLDGIYLDLHGAMVVDGFDDGEGELLRRLRDRLGDTLPIAASFDLHANLSAAAIDRLTLVDGYRNYPHDDMAETGGRTFRRLLAHIDAKVPRPATVMVRPDFLIALTWQCTLIEPAIGLKAQADALMADDPTLAIFQAYGFPLADIPDCGPAIVVQHPDPARAEAVATTLLAAWQAAEPAFDGPIPSARDAVRQAITLSASAGADAGPVVIADTQDNPGGGGLGDTPGMLQALLDERAVGAVLVHIADTAAAEAAHAVGVGGAIPNGLGGKLLPGLGAPVAGPWTVEALGDGRFTGVGPMYRGNRIALGPVALLAQSGVRVIVAGPKMQASEPALLHHVGIDPQTVPILVVKSSVHFRAAYQPMARAILVGQAPGPVTADLRALPYARLRTGVRIAGEGV